MNQISTVAYFSIDVNPDGTLNGSGSGWNGYVSQDLSNLITRAHPHCDLLRSRCCRFDGYASEGADHPHPAAGNCNVSQIDHKSAGQGGSDSGDGHTFR